MINVNVSRQIKIKHIGLIALLIALEGLWRRRQTAQIKRI